MGASNSHIDSVLYCGQECQKQQKIQEYKTKYLDLVNEEKTLPNKVSQAKQQYYMLKDGPEWYNKMIKNESNKSSDGKYQVEKQKLDDIKYRYNNISKLLSTQNILLDKQKKEIKEKINTMKKEETTVYNLKNVFSTTNREIDYLNKEHSKYEIGNRDIVYIVILLVLSVLLSGAFLFKTDMSDTEYIKIMIYLISLISYIYFLEYFPSPETIFTTIKGGLFPLLLYF